MYPVNVGDVFGSLTVLEESEVKVHQSMAWICICKCGQKTKPIRSSELYKRKYCSAQCLIRAESNSNGPTAIYTIYKYSAEQRGYKFNISLEFLADIISQNCHYCNLPPSNNYKKKIIKIKYSGIDRKDNAVGYEEWNVVPCCKQCNKAKSTMGYDEFKDWIQRLVDNFKL